MKLWIETDAIQSAGRQVSVKVSEIAKNVNRKAASRTARVVNAMRNAELEVLRGQRSGKTYRKPFTKAATYTASAPGEPPARRTGALRLQWTGGAETTASSEKRTEITAYLESGVPYAGYLENGTSKMAPRPYVDAIKEKAEPEIKKIMGESYS